jgi:hypothetical protein
LLNLNHLANIIRGMGIANKRLQQMRASGSFTLMSEVETKEQMVDERRAAILLGLALPELRWFSRLLGLGHERITGEASQVVFTYEELKRLSSTAAASAK